jgi:hypothetical protein
LKRALRFSAMTLMGRSFLSAMTFKNLDNKPDRDARVS